MPDIEFSRCIVKIYVRSLSSLSNTTNKKSMMSIFSSIDDPRKPYNQKHKFMDIVAIVILATLAGADSWDEMVT